LHKSEIIRNFAGEFNRKGKSMCTVTLQYDQSSALARRKIAALMATGLFTQIAMQSQTPSEEEIREERELTQAFMEHSKRSMSDIIARYV
jgi:hypothetical protein